MKLNIANVVVDLLCTKFSRLNGLFKDIIRAATIDKVKFWCSKQTTCLHRCYAIHTVLSYFTEVLMCREAPHTRLGCARLSGEFSYSSFNADCLQQFSQVTPYPKLPRSTQYYSCFACIAMTRDIFSFTFTSVQIAVKSDLLRSFLRLSHLN